MGSNRKVWKRILTTSLSVTMLAGSLPYQALAATEVPVYEENAEVTLESVQTGREADQVIASFNFDSEQDGLTGAGAKAEVRGNVQYRDYMDGKALYLDGNGGHLSVTKESGESLLTGVEELTISYDAKAERTATNWMFYAAPNDNTQSWPYEQYLGIMAKDGNSVAERYKNSGSRPANPSVITGSDWVHLDVVVAKGHTDMYVNGLLKDSVASSIAVPDILGDKSLLYIGKANWEGGEYAKALIDNFEIRSRAMSEMEIAEKQGIELSALKGVTSDSLSIITSEVNADTKTATLYVSKTNTKTDDFTAVPLNLQMVEGAEIEGGQQDAYDLTQPVTLTINHMDQRQVWTVQTVMCNSPVLPGEFADPDIDVFNGKFYIYPTTDGVEGWGGYLFHAFSSEDLVNWEDEGVILDLKATESYQNEKGVEVATVPWASGNAWAPSIEKKNGRYYFYFCGNNGNAKAIGVAVADSPAGPYTVKETPLLTIEDCQAEGIKMGQVIDPSIYTEEDGTSYMLFGNGNPAIVQLGEDMMSWVPGTLKNYAGAEGFREAITVTKKDGKYHFTWSQDDTGSENYQVNYGVGDNLYGPITYKYPILQKDTDKDIKGTGHHSVLQVPGKEEYYIAYHRFLTPLGQVTGGFGYHRETCVDKLTFGEDGLIQKTAPTLEGNQTPVVLNTVQVSYTAGEHGTIQGDLQQSVIVGTESNRVTAVPDTGYVFEKWSDGMTDPVRFEKNVQSAAAYTAIFKEEPKATVTYEAGMGGTIEGETVQIIDKGGSTTEVTAVPKEGYTFVQWSDGMKTPKRSDKNVPLSMSVRAEFKAAEETVIAAFDFDSETDGFKGNGAVAKVNGAGTLTGSYPGGGKSVSLSRNNWLSLEKEDGSALLKGLEEITVSYDSRAVNYQAGWSFFAAPNTNAQTYNSEHYLGILDKGTKVTAERYNNSGSRPAVSQADSTVAWKHVDMVIESGKTTLYIDGKKKAETASSHKLSDILGQSGGIVQIGKGNWGNGEYYNGQIDNLKIYSVARTPEELAIPNEDKDIVARAKAGLEIPNMDDIRGNITLVETLEGAEISWQSSDPGVITDKKNGDKEAGVVTRGKTDKKVTLTATIQKGEAKDSRKFVVTVAKAPEELKEDDFTAYLFGSFTGTEGSRTDEQIYFATSKDGYYYTDLNDKKPVLESPIGENGVRDPYILRSAEGDKFFMIATDLSIYYRGGWGNASATTTGSRDLIVWESTDLVNWSEPRAVAVGPLDAGCAWAPEAIYNEKTGEYVVYYATAHVIDGKTDQDLRIFSTTTRDFVSFTEPQEYIWRAKNRSIIDTTMIWNAEDGYYYRASADGQITLERSKDIFGEWEKVTTLNDLGLGGDMTGGKLEGPELFKFNKKDWVDGKPTYGLYTDQYAEGRGYLPVITTDLSDATNANKSWKKLSSNEYSFDTLKKRHGTILNLTQEEYDRVMKAYHSADLTYEAGEGGTIQGETSQNVIIGGDAKTVTAVPNEGYEFVKWDDGLTTAARTDKDVKGDKTYTAIFQKKEIPVEKVTLTYEASEGGTIQGETSQEVAIGGDAKTVTAVPDEGYEFVKWDDGLTTASRTDKNVTEKKTYTAIFQKKEIPAEQVTVTYAAGEGGRIEGNAKQTITKGGSTTAVKAVANAGYTFVKWSDGKTEASRVDSNVTESKTITAEFKKDAVVQKPKVELSQKKIQMGVKEKVTLKATVLPAGSSQKVTYKSSKSSVVKVSSKGVLTAKKTGKATITVTSANGAKATCKVTVKKAPKKFSLTAKSKTLKRGKTYQIKAKFPKGTYSNKLTFKSSKKSVAAVSKTGKVTAKKKGTAVITVSTFNKKKATIRIKVK